VLGTVTAGYDLKLAPGIIVGGFADFDVTNANFKLTSPSGDLNRLHERNAFNVGGRVDTLIMPDTLMFAAAGYTRANFKFNYSDEYSNGRMFDGWSSAAASSESLVARGASRPSIVSPTTAERSTAMTAGQGGWRARSRGPFDRCQLAFRSVGHQLRVRSVATKGVLRRRLCVIAGPSRLQLLSPFYLAGRPLFGMLGQALVTCRNLQHLPLGRWMGHLFGLTPRILRPRQPIAHIVHCGSHMSPSLPAPLKPVNAAARIRFPVLLTFF
jgi:hypothetical protein